MFKFSTATILATYAHSISLTIEALADSTLAVENCADCTSQSEWVEAIRQLADAFIEPTDDDMLMPKDMIKAKPLKDYYADKYADSTYRSTLTAVEMSALTSIQQYFATRCGYHCFEENEKLGTRYFNLATSKEADEWLMGTLKDLERLHGGSTNTGEPVMFIPPWL